MSNVKVDKWQDVLDSRDIIARIEELENEKDQWGESLGETEGYWEEQFEEDAAELASLKELAEEAEGYSSDWVHGEALIRDSYFKEYAQEFADVMIPPEASNWPLRHIDWEAAAEELKQDYTSVTLDGVNYWIRCS